MGERSAEANGLDHDYDFPYSTHNGAPRATSTERDQIANLVKAMYK